VEVAARPVTAGTRVVAATRGWLLPYLLIAVVAAVELLADVTVGAFLVLAPLLASRLSTRRGQVIAVGLVTLVVAAALGVWTGKLAGDQLAIRLVLIALATLFALVNWGASQREQSALERAADTIRMAGSLAAGLEPQEAYDLLARRPGRCTRPTRPPSTAARASRWSPSARPATPRCRRCRCGCPGPASRPPS